MDKLVYFDYCAVVIIGILLLSTISRKMTRGKQNQHFLFIIILILITTIADVCAINLDRMGAGNAAAKHIAHTVYLLAHMLTTPCYVTYLFTLSDIWHYIRRRRFVFVSTFLPAAFGTVLLRLNPFNHLLY